MKISLGCFILFNLLKFIKLGAFSLFPWYFNVSLINSHYLQYAAHSRSSPTKNSDSVELLLLLAILITQQHVVTWKQNVLHMHKTTIAERGLYAEAFSQMKKLPKISKMML